MGTVAGELATKEDIKELRAEIKENEERVKRYVDVRIAEDDADRLYGARLAGGAG